MTRSIVSVSPFRNRVSFKEAFEGLELGEGKLSRPVLRGPGGREAAWLLGDVPGAFEGDSTCTSDVITTPAPCVRVRSINVLETGAKNDLPLKKTELQRTVHLRSFTWP
jgi:hypothetical protein